MSVRVELTRFGGPLSLPAGNARQSYREREGVLVTLMDAQGTIGQGEATPLPGYSPDGLDDCIDVLERLPWNRAMALFSEQAPLDALDALGTLIPSGFPAARFAAETALADLVAKRAGLPLFAWLRAAPTGAGDDARPPPAAPAPLDLSALLDGASEEHLELAARAFERGVRTFKVKLGSDQATEFRTLDALRARFGASVKLRCDLNQTLAIGQAREWLAGLRAFDLELLEEPTKTEDLSALETTIPLALDESLRAPRLAATALSHPSVRALVLKPMVLGGLSASAAWARRARGNHQVILSHLFDGPVALAASAHAALAWGTPELAMGLDWHAGLSAWPSARISVLTSSQIVAASQPGLGLEWSRVE